MTGSAKTGPIAHVVLDEVLCYPLIIILASSEPYMAHNMVYFTYSPSSDIFHNPLPTIRPPATLP